MSFELLVDCQELRRAFRGVLFAADVNPVSRYALASVRLEHGAAVATDGRRLCAVDIDASPADPVLIRRDIAAEYVRKCTVSARGPATISLNGDCRISWNGFNRRPKEVSGALLEGRYPRWREIVPDESTRIGRLSGQVADFTLPDPTSPGWLLSCGGAGLVELTRPSVSLPASVKYDGSRTDLYFDLSYLADWLSTLADSADVTIDLFGPDRAVVCRSGSSQYVFMPLNRDK